MTEKRVKMRVSDHALGDPNTHSNCEHDEVQTWIDRAAALGEKIHVAKVIVKVGPNISPYALCDQADDLFPDLGKFMFTGDYPEDAVSCERCIQVLADIEAGTFNPLEEFGGMEQ